MTNLKRLKKLKPAFWDHSDITGSHPQTGFSFVRKWKLIVLFTSIMALLPLMVMTLVDFNLTRRIIENEIKNSTSQILRAAAASFPFAVDREESIKDYLAHFNPGRDNDLFVIHENGTLLTPSYYYGASGTPHVMDTDLFFEETGSIKDTGPGDIPIISGYTAIKDSSLWLVLSKNEKEVTDLWLKPRLKLIKYLIVSIALILVSILGTATYLVHRIHLADQRRVEAVHQAEYTNKLASIGRLASGVAHEVNNPLAIINQKTGLVIDLLSMEEHLKADERLIPLANDVLGAVERCGTITRRLLDFARHMEPCIESVDVKKVIEQILAFHEKEAERRGITIRVDSPDIIPEFECDRGNLQQIFLNLVTNAFEAMEDGGQLNIRLALRAVTEVVITFSDTGSGISHDDLDKIFEPFYTSKTDNWGTGLGLSITYGLVKEIQGDINVKSIEGQGTSFTLVLPVKMAEATNGTKDVKAETG